MGAVHCLRLRRQEKCNNELNVLMQTWISVFGNIGLVMTDNCGEFSIDKLRKDSSVLNVKYTITTATEGPFKNGFCERVNADTDTMLLKLEMDIG